MTSAAVSFRSATGLRAMNIRPVLLVPCVPPVNPTTLSTPGSAITTSTNCPSFCRSA